MKRLVLATLFALSAVVMTSDTASAQQPNSFGFLPFGFYQPYGARYGTSLRTPPYFATNPPVYYGARHSRPYGISPFAAPPMVTAGGNYTSRLRTQFEQPQVPTPAPLCNPCVSISGANVSGASLRVSDAVTSPAKLGAVQINPFVNQADQVAVN